jgi:hypothetical protein
MDSADGIIGIPGRGIKYWEKMMKTKDDIRLDDILNEYIEKHGQSQGVYNFQKNYRLLHMLENDEDFIREVGSIPTFPTIHEVQREVF